MYAKFWSYPEKKMTIFWSFFLRVRPYFQSSKSGGNQKKKTRAELFNSTMLVRLIHVLKVAGIVINKRNADSASSANFIAMLKLSNNVK